MSATFKDHFSGISARYADFRPHYPQQLFDYLATLVPDTSTVWDCAAGTGQATIDLARRFSKVIATDASPQQVQSAPQIKSAEFRVAPAETSGLPNHSVQLVTVAQALHWFDFARFFAEVDRVLQPAGALAVWAYGAQHLEEADLDSIVQEYYSEIVGPYWPPEKRFVEEEYRSIQLPFTEIETPQFRMETQWTLEQLLGYFSTWSATNRYIQAQGKNPIDELRPRLKSLWPDEHAEKRIIWPLAIRVTRKPA